MTVHLSAKYLTVEVGCDHTQLTNYEYTPFLFYGRMLLVIILSTGVHESEGLSHHELITKNVITVLRVGLVLSLVIG